MPVLSEHSAEHSAMGHVLRLPEPALSLSTNRRQTNTYTDVLWTILTRLRQQTMAHLRALTRAFVTLR